MMDWLRGFLRSQGLRGIRILFWTALLSAGLLVSMQQPVQASALQRFPSAFAAARSGHSTVGSAATSSFIFAARSAAPDVTEFANRHRRRRSAVVVTSKPDGFVASIVASVGSFSQFFVTFSSRDSVGRSPPRF